MTSATKIMGMKAHPQDVHTGIPDEARREIAQSISRILTDTYLLVIKSHVYHWNVVGPLFHPIHTMTEEHYENLFRACDELAERIRALGHPAPLTDKRVLEDGNITIESTGPSARAMVEDLVSDHEGLCRRMREAAEMSEEKGDFVSHDLLTGRLTYHEKVIWMLRSIIME